MTDPCSCDQPSVVEPRIAAGLDALPRQLRTFSNVRNALLHGVSQKGALADWRARGGRDLGVMWLEMWAYVSDLLAFYDERIANESYLRTAQLKPSLRRIAGMLGYVPAPGVAGSATLAAIAEGRTAVTVPAGTAFRSDAFANHPPQVFESTLDTPIHPFKNQWQIGAIKHGTLPQLTPSQAPGQRGAGTAPGAFFVFETTGLNLRKDQLALFEFSSGLRAAAKVASVSTFTGKDGRNYAEVELATPIATPAGGFTPEQVRVLTPTASATISKNPLAHSVHPAHKLVDDDLSSPVRAPRGLSIVGLDSVYRQLKVKDTVISAVDAASAPGSNVAGAYQVVQVQDVDEGFAELQTSVPSNLKDQSGNPIPIPPPQVPVSIVRFDQVLSRTTEPSQVVFHFAFVDAGTVSTVPDDQISVAELKRDGGLPIIGLAEVPPDAVAINPFPTRSLPQNFLLIDADEKGAQVSGTMLFSAGGRATFQIKQTDPLAEATTFKAPITVFGNLLEVTRGETVFSEVLGRGDPRQLNQEFTLSRKPLTYVFSNATISGIDSTLDLKVELRGSEGAWREVASFFGQGPDERVYVIRRDDDQNTIIQFGDGVRGARPPSGADIIATYRVGSGAAAPPAGAITQIARPFVGLRSVRSPIDARPGLDPDSADKLRTHAAQSMLTFGRAVSVKDFETFARLSSSVDKAVAEFVWIESEQRAGVQVTYIGDADVARLTDRLRRVAEPNLAISVRKAIGWASTLNIDLVHDNVFDRDDVIRRVHGVLTDTTEGKEGILSRARAEIGGQLWVSRIYQAVQAQPGVVNVRSINLTVPGSSRISLQRAALVQLPGVAATQFELMRLLFASSVTGKLVAALSQQEVVCTPPGTFIDFANGAGVIVSSIRGEDVSPLGRRPTEDV